MKYEYRIKIIALLNVLVSSCTYQRLRLVPWRFSVAPDTFRPTNTLINSASSIVAVRVCGHVSNELQLNRSDSKPTRYTRTKLDQSQISDFSIFVLIILYISIAK